MAYLRQESQEGFPKERNGHAVRGGCVHTGVVEDLTARAEVEVTTEVEVGLIQEDVRAQIRVGAARTGIGGELVEVPHIAGRVVQKVGELGVGSLDNGGVVQDITDEGGRNSTLAQEM